jgi:stromal interaction molecule 1
MNDNPLTLSPTNCQHVLEDSEYNPGETHGKNHNLVQFDGDARREKIFHRKDDEITVADLWQTWAKSEVYNWTVEQTAEWLTHSVDLPQYAHVFIEKNVNGAKLPLAASDPSFLTKILGISNSIHRSKISLKAMDVVLFGPPKEPTNWLKDIIVSGLLLALLTSLFWAFNQKKRSEEHLAKMMKDMESLTKAERMLQEMQSHMQEDGEEREYHEEQQVSTRSIRPLLMVFSI